MNLKKWLLLTTSLFILSGCSQPGETSISPTPTGIQYMAEDLFETTDEKETVTLPGENVENQEEAELSKITEVPEYLKPQENIEYVKYDAANRQMNFYYSEKNWKSMFCIDRDTGVVYFVNQNKDWYIYRLVNGEAELVVELPARELYVLNGIVYFILEDYDKYEFDALTEGDIYAYTLADGKVEKIYSPGELEGEIYRMIPCEDGIAFSCVTRSEEVKIDAQGQEYRPFIYFYYFYTFADSALTTDPYKRAIPGWGEYYLDYDASEYTRKSVLKSRKNHDEIYLIAPGGRSFIVENTMYSFGLSKTYCITNLLTGEQQIYDILTIFGELAPKYVASCEGSGLNFGAVTDGFTVTKDYIWITLNNYFLMRLDPVSGEAKCYSLAGLNSKLCELYTDGINLYATYAQTGEWRDEGTLVRICTEKIVGQDSLFDVPLLAVEHLTD